MNLLLLLAGARIWDAGPVAAFARTTAALALLSIEMQVVTLAGVGGLRSLAAVNAVLAMAGFLLLSPARVRGSRAVPAARPRWPALPWAAIAGLACVGLLLAGARPIEGADPYHLDRVAQILRLGSLEFDTAADIKVNVLASSYELALADLAQIPVAGPVLLRLHGLVSLAYFTLAVAAIRRWLPGGRTWCWSAVFVVPVVFHQLALVKNDLYSTTPALVAVCWMLVRAAAASTDEIAMASALVGFAVAIKWVSFPLALIMTGVVVWHRARRAPAPALAALVLGGVAGAVAGGLPFTLAQTARWYGHPLEPLAALGNRTTSLASAVGSVARFALSLVDFGWLTRQWWPGRGGWGATFGAPLLWAAGVAAIEWRRSPTIRQAVGLACLYGAAFAAAYPDADLAHRLVLAPGLLVIAVAASRTDGDEPRAVWIRRALAAALAITVAQIGRSTMLYLTGYLS